MAATLWIYVDMVLIVWLKFKPSIRMCKKVNLSDFVVVGAKRAGLSYLEIADLLDL